MHDEVERRGGGWAENFLILELLLSHRSLSTLSGFFLVNLNAIPHRRFVCAAGVMQAPSLFEDWAEWVW